MSNRNRSKAGRAKNRSSVENRKQTVILPDLSGSRRVPLDPDSIEGLVVNQSLLEGIKRNMEVAGGPESEASLRAGELISQAIDRGIEPGEVAKAMRAGLVEGIKNPPSVSPERER